MTITIQVENWRHLPESAALEFVLKELAKDVANGILKKGKSICGDYYNDNGLEYRALVS